MDETCRNVQEFHEAFDIRVEPFPYVPKLRPTEIEELAKIAELMELTEKWCKEAAENARKHESRAAFLRLGLIQEELAELARALVAEDLVAALDGLTDIQYVLDGAYLAFGLQNVKLSAHREVHRSNMTKSGPDNPDGGKVVKGPGYEPPDLAKVLEKTHG